MLAINYTISEGTKPGALEVKFNAKPAAETREALKALRFRWNGAKSVWYGFATAEEVAAVLNGAPIEKPEKATKKAAALAPLFERFSVADLPAYGTGNPMKAEAEANAKKNGSSYDKEAAKIIRAHLRARFPECKFSVVSGGAGWLNSCDIRIMSAPWGKVESVDNWGDSCKIPGAELAALLDYCNALHNAFDADDGDIYADYGAHHDLYGGASVSWEFTETEPTAEQAAQIDEYHKALEEEEARKAEAFKRECEIDERESAIINELHRVRAEYENNRAAEVEAAAIVEDIPEEARPRFAGLLGDFGKACTVDELRARVDRTETAEIARRVTFKDSEAFRFFCDNLLRDWSFLAGMGGSATDDPRINDMNEWQKLSPEQRKSVKWYICNAVAIYEGERLALVIDPQGYNYARYAFIADEAEPVTAEPVEDLPPFYIPAPIEEQAQNITEGEAITLLTVDPWTMNAAPIRGKVEAVSVAPYAQYKSALHLTFTPEGKRKPVLMVIREGQEAAIFSGILPDVPQEMSSRKVNENISELLFCGGNADKFLHNCAKYYKDQGYKTLVDTIPA